jgi:hypothetical protein
MPKEIQGNSSKSELVMELIGVLKKEASLFETFLELVEQQQKALVKNDMETINRITEAHREKVIESGILSKKRESIIAEIIDDEDARNDLTISRLIKMVSEEQSGILGNLRNMMLELNDKITKVGNQNEMLINRSRENIMKTMELLGRIITPEDSYQNQGKKNRSQASLALDRRA